MRNMEKLVRNMEKLFCAGYLLFAFAAGIVFLPRGMPLSAGVQE